MRLPTGTYLDGSLDPKQFTTFQKPSVVGLSLEGDILSCPIVQLSNIHIDMSF